MQGEKLLDLSYREDSAASADMNVVMTGQGRLVEVQVTAEGETFSRQELDELLDLAGEGVAMLSDAQKKVLGEKQWNWS